MRKNYEALHYIIVFIVRPMPESVVCVQLCKQEAISVGPP